jgi:hypothetical protein
LLNLPENDDIYNYLPYESAVNELGGEIFESLFLNRTFIGKIYHIDKSEELEKIVEYNRLYDLMIKRFMAVQFLECMQVLQNSKISQFNSNLSQCKMKQHLEEVLHLEMDKSIFFTSNMVHRFDMIRGTLLIQEKFVQKYINEKEFPSILKKKSLDFITRKFFYSFSEIQNHFSSF